MLNYFGTVGMHDFVFSLTVRFLSLASTKVLLGFTKLIL
jgi:hypothetical protein